ncbi:MAG: phospholipase D-like domain-containing protein, partial [Bradymonadaceae bacterium]
MYSLVHLILAEVIGYSWGLILLGVADLLALLSVPSVLLRRQGRPLAAMSWLLALFVLPYLGVLFWWIVGREHLHRRRRLRRRSTEEFYASLEELDGGPRAWIEPNPFGHLLPRGLFEGYGPPQVMGPSLASQIELLVDGDEMFPALEQMIGRADDYVHLLFYIWKSDETGRRLRDLLVDKARQGVEVRVLVDGVGSPDFRSELAEPLLEAGGHVGTFLPPTRLARQPTFNFRNHRKLVVVDGREALTGGLNIAEEYEHDWHEIAVRLRGSVVRDLHTVFLDDWLFATRENLATDPYLQPADEEPSDARSADGEAAACAVFSSGPDAEQPTLRDGLLHAINA